MKKALPSYFDYKHSLSEKFATMHSHGFDSLIAGWWTTPMGETISDLLTIADKNSLEIISIHSDFTAFGGVNNLWRDNLDGQNFSDNMIKCVKNASEYKVSNVVIHLSSTFTPPAPSSVGISRLDKLCRSAEKYGVKLAFENLRLPVYNRYVFDNLSYACVGTCYDCGHENIYCKGYDVISYLDKPIITSHLHDNNGSFDEHNLPFDGTVDWVKVINNLVATNTDGIFLESQNLSYNLPLEEFVSRAKSCADRLEEMFIARKAEFNK
ncbi:MAG: sugar phosphate isomerase/epimerase [Clostridia bacterium]